MRRHATHDPLASSLTDLMTSLMVIFVLLLLVFMQRHAGVTAVITDALLKRLQDELRPQGFSAANVRRDARDRYAILVIVPDRLMNFETGKFVLKPQGEAFLSSRIPHLAQVLCSPEYRSSVDSIVVEGHSDAQPFSALPFEESQALNLKLSQDRSMEVVKKSLVFLGGFPERGCFLEKLSASGRGEQDQESTADESRRVIFKIRVKTPEADSIERRVRQ